MTAAAPSRARVVGAFAALYFVWGSTFPGMRIALQSFPPFLMSGLRYGLAGLLLYVISRATGAGRPTGKQWWGCALTGFALILIGNGGTAYALKYIPASLGALLAATIPMFLALFAWWCGMTARPGWSVFAGLGIGFLGVGLLLKPGNALLAGDGAWFGSGVILAVAVIWAIGSLYLKRIPREDLPPSLGLGGGMQMLCGGAMLLFVSAATGEWSGFQPMAITARALWALVYLLFFGSLVGFLAYTWLLRVCDTAKVGTYAFVNPVVAVFLAWWLEGEPIGLQTLAGAALIITGAALIILRQNRQTKPLPSAPTVAE